jgi:rRNA maturation protein Nop10
MIADICPHCGGDLRKPNPRRLWTSNEDYELRRLYKAGDKYKVIAAKLARPLSSIQSRVERLCLPPRSRM